MCATVLVLDFDFDSGFHLDLVWVLDLVLAVALDSIRFGWVVAFWDKFSACQVELC